MKKLTKIAAVAVVAMGLALPVVPALADDSGVKEFGAIGRAWKAA